MPLILELSQELEAELLVYWQRAALIQTKSEFSNHRQQMENSDNNLGRFQLPSALHNRLQDLLDRQDAGEVLATAERLEAESLVELAEFLSLLHLRALHIASDM